MKWFLFFLLFPLLCAGQNFTESYNSIMGRYEYRNSAGQLVGYKTYDSIMNRWKYTDLTQQNNVYSQPAYEYPTPTSSVDTRLIQQVLATKQNNYNQNQQRIFQAITDIVSQVGRMGLSDNETDEFNIRFIKVESNLKSAGFDFSKASETNTFIQTLYKEAGRIVNDIRSNRPKQVSATAIPFPLTHNFNGGYSVKFVQEFSFIDNSFRLVGTDYNSTQIYFTPDMLFFRRHGKAWDKIPLKYYKYDVKTYSYHFFTPHGSLFIKDDFKTITFVEISGKTLSKQFIYHINSKDTSVNPR